MARATVLYFASARDLVGRKNEELSFEGNPTAGALLERIVSAHPALMPMKSSIRLSVNHELVDSDAAVGDGDEVGVLPPVAGG
ncbi:MAG: MoaD/ThiS family protein [Nitrososphaerales archaeon]|nr:MoaD/ThiS family protein [Nitrososphaerales archaeon]